MLYFLVCWMKSGNIYFYRVGILLSLSTSFDFITSFIIFYDFSWLFSIKNWLFYFSKDISWHFISSFKQNLQLSFTWLNINWICANLIPGHMRQSLTLNKNILLHNRQIYGPWIKDASTFSVIFDPFPLIPHLSTFGWPSSPSVQIQTLIMIQNFSAKILFQIPISTTTPHIEIPRK